MTTTNKSTFMQAAAKRVMEFYNEINAENTKATESERFEIAKRNALYFMLQEIKDVEELTFTDCFQN